MLPALSLPHRYDLRPAFMGLELLPCALHVLRDRRVDVRANHVAFGDDELSRIARVAKRGSEHLKLVVPFIARTLRQQLRKPVRSHPNIPFAFSVCSFFIGQLSHLVSSFLIPSANLMEPAKALTGRASLQGGFPNGASA